MADIGQSIERVITNSSKALGNYQVAINKVLWGKGNVQPKQTAKYDDKTGGLVYTTVPTTAKTPGKSTLLNSGLFNALDAIAQVNLCDILSYLQAHTNIKKKPPPPRNTWNAAQVVFYDLQDAAGFVVQQIDKYTAYPNTLITSFTESGPNGLGIQSANDIASLTAKTLSGYQVVKYNTYYLIQSIRDTLVGTNPTGGSLFTSEERALLAQIPGLNNQLTTLDDFISKLSQYTDYRNISNADIITIQRKIALIRTVCVAIQAVDITTGAVAVGNFLGTDVRSQIQQLSKFIDPTKLIPTLKEVNSALQTFIQIAQRLNQLLKTAQFLVKILILFVKVFIFISKFLLKLPLPNIYTTSGVQSTLSGLAEKAKSDVDKATRTLKEVNALIQVIIDFVRYLIANANQLAIKIQAILDSLKDCDAVKDPAGNVSPVIAQLTASLQTLNTVQKELTDFITTYDTRKSPNTAKVGKYDIRVVDEQLTDSSIPNKRRRGIALDETGAIVAQSDLTFATNTAVIIEEVKLKLIQQGLIVSTLAGAITGEQASIIAESLDYLQNNDISISDLNAPGVELDPPDNEDENVGIGLNAFVNKLRGGRRLRRRVRRAMARASAQFAAQLASEGVSARNSIASTVQNSTVGSGQNTKTYQVRIYDPTTLGLTLTPTRILLRTVTVQAISDTQAIEEAKDIADEYRTHPRWIYVPQRTS